MEDHTTPMRPGRPLPIFRRHAARRLAVWNVALWSIGNGLASTTLVIYLANELHAERLGLGIGLLLATPQLAGLLRLAAPALIRRTGGRKRFCIATYLVGAGLLVALPWVASPGILPTAGWSLAALIGLWCLHHLLQYLGTVALWSWLADVASPKIRGRFFGWRERWLVGGQAAAAVASGGFVWGVLETSPSVPKWLPYALMATLGGVVMAAAVIPLGQMPAAEYDRIRGNSAAGSRKSSSLGSSIGGLLRPFGDLRFLPLLAFGCWLSFFNGVTQAAQNFFPLAVLGIPLLLSHSLQTGMRLGQWSVSPSVGRLADRVGSRAVMIVSQLIAAAGLLMYAAATPDQLHWFIGAWVCWIAYVGLNVCVPTLLLRLSPPDANSAYIAAYYAMTGICYAASTVAGGWLVDHYQLLTVSVGPFAMGFFPCLFIAGWVARSLGVLWLLRIREEA